MKVRDYIFALEQLEKEHGNLEVETLLYGTRIIAPFPLIRYRKILKGRESKPKLWDSLDGEEKKGEKVIEV